MEQADKELILSLTSRDKQLRRLYEEHLFLEGKLLEFQRRAYLTPLEEIEERRIKKQKLRGVDRMMNIIARSRTGSHAHAA